MNEVRPELHLWQAYCEKKMELEDMEDRVHELEAVIREILSQIDQGGSNGKVFARDHCIQNARAKLGEKNAHIRL